MKINWKPCYALEPETPRIICVTSHWWLWKQEVRAKLNHCNSRDKQNERQSSSQPSHQRVFLVTSQPSQPSHQIWSHQFNQVKNLNHSDRIRLRGYVSGSSFFKRLHLFQVCLTDLLLSVSVRWCRQRQCHDPFHQPTSWIYMIIGRLSNVIYWVTPNVNHDFRFVRHSFPLRRHTYQCPEWLLN